MKNWSIDIRIRFIKGDQIVYGKGVSELLQCVDELKSIRAAASQLGMTYRKALKIIRNAEEGFGREIMIKKIGGEHGGGSTLTEFGKELVYHFKEYEADVLNYTQRKKEDYFNDLFGEQCE